MSHAKKEKEESHKVSSRKEEKKSEGVENLPGKKYEEKSYENIENSLHHSESTETVVSSSSSSSKSSFYKEMFFSAERFRGTPQEEFSSVINYKNFFNFININDSDGSEDRPLFKCELCHKKDTGVILCDVCFGSIHEKCLLNYVVREDFICERCKYLVNSMSGVKEVSCMYCPKKNVRGLMKQLQDNWAHYDCYEYFKDENNLKSIQTSGICEVCKSKSSYLLKCQYENCTKSFHYRCGLKSYRQSLYCQEHLILLDDILLKKKRQRENSKGNKK